MTFVRLDSPLGAASGYTLHLYCKYGNSLHGFGEFPHEFFHEEKPKTWRSARKSGWIVHRDRTATCPKCAKLLKAGVKPA